MAMTEAEMLTDLAAADAAGDTQLAQRIAEQIRAARGARATPTESLAAGGEQGISMGFSDELKGLRRANAGSFLASSMSALPFVGPLLAPSPADRIAAYRAKQPTLTDLILNRRRDSSFAGAYREGRDEERARLAQAEADHPNLYLGGEIGGAVATALIPGGGAKAAGTLSKGARLLRTAKGAGRLAGQGAIQGAGYSDASDSEELAGDTALGAGVGLAGRAFGKGLGWAGRKIGGLGRALIDRGTQRAEEQAAKEVADELASAAGKAGAEVQKGSRYVENLMRLEEAMTPEQRALYAQLQASGVVPNLQQSVAGSTLSALPQQASTIAARQAELAALQQGAQKATEDRAADLLAPKALADTKSFLKSYAEPLVWAYLGNKAAEVAGASPEQRTVAAGAAGLIGGRTRAGKALMNRITRPANQVALGKALQTTGDLEQSTLGALVRQLLSRGIPAAATASAVAAPDGTR